MTETAEGERDRVFGEKCLFNVEKGEGGRKGEEKWEQMEKNIHLNFIAERKSPF
jgi:hypothetical protein